MIRKRASAQDTLHIGVSDSISDVEWCIVDAMYQTLQGVEYRRSSIVHVESRSVATHELNRDYHVP